MSDGPFISAVHIVLTIFCMMGIGYIMARIGWLNGEMNNLLSKMVVRVALPATIVQNLFTKYDLQTFQEGAYGMLAPLFTLTTLYLLSKLVIRIAHIPKGRQGVFSALFTFSNSIFVGLPICKAVLGDAAIPSSLFFYIVNTIFFWTIGAEGVRRDNPANLVRTSPLRTLGRVLSPPLVTFTLSIILVLLGVKLPSFVMQTASYVGGMVTPLSMFFIGAMLFNIQKTGIRWEKGYGWMLFGRFLLSPALMFGICLLLGLPPIMKDAFFLQAAMPAQTQNAIVAHASGADAEYAAGGIALSTLLSLIFIPLYALFLQFV